MTDANSAARTLVSSHQIILFVDIVGSTAIYERAGDLEARQIIGTALARMTELIVNSNGRVAAELGDELMCFFTQPADAAAAACELHAQLGAEFSVPGGGPLKLRIGMHYGPVVGHKDDLMSEAAKIAHWAASNAKADQTLATLTVIDALPRIYRAVSRYVDDETWNFVSFDHVALYEIVWDVESITAVAVENVGSSAPRSEAIAFTLAGDVVLVSGARPVISIGRGTQNDLIVQHDLVSRQHFTAQYSRGRCTITDKSTNGTFVISAQGALTAVRRETFALAGSGRIALGNPDDLHPAVTIQFDCR